MQQVLSTIHTEFSSFQITTEIKFLPIEWRKSETKMSPTTNRLWINQVAKKKKFEVNKYKLSQAKENLIEQVVIGPISVFSARNRILRPIT